MGEATRAPSKEWIMPSPSMGPVIAPIGGKLPIFPKRFKYTSENSTTGAQA